MDQSRPFKSVKLDTVLFGEITVDGDLHEEYSIPLNGREITFYLCVDEESVGEGLEKIGPLFLDNIPFMYQKARSEILAKKDLEFISYFVADHLKDEGVASSIVSIFPVESVKEITKEMFLAALEPRTISIWLVQNELQCVFDFSLDRDITDSLLVIYFNQQFEITDISIES